MRWLNGDLVEITPIEQQQNVCAFFDQSRDGRSPRYGGGACIGSGTFNGKGDSAGMHGAVIEPIDWPSVLGFRPLQLTGEQREDQD